MTKKIYVALLAVALAAPLAASAQDAGVFKVPGTDSTIKLYGYTQLDMTLDFAGRPTGYENSDWATTLASVPTDKSPDGKHLKNQFYFTARTSRFGIQTSTPTKVGNISVKLEGDFNGTNAFQTESYTNSTVFRLRQAYGQVGGFLAGQTWSTFADLNAYADTVDFNGPGDTALVRNPMLRYTFDLAPGMSLSLAAENRRGLQFGPDAKFQTLPDFIAKFDYAGGWGTFSIRGMTNTYNRAELTAGGNFADLSPKSVQGFAGAASASVKVGGDTLVLYFAGGPGIGRYLLNAGSYPVYLDGTSLKAQTAFGGHVGYTHVWNPEWRSNAVIAYTALSDRKIGGVADTSGAKDFTQVFVNSFYSFAKTASVGVEFVYGLRNDYVAAGNTDDKATQARLNAAFHYNFY